MGQSFTRYALKTCQNKNRELHRKLNNYISILQENPYDVQVSNETVISELNKIVHNTYSNSMFTRINDTCNSNTLVHTQLRNYIKSLKNKESHSIEDVVDELHRFEYAIKGIPKGETHAAYAEEHDVTDCLKVETHFLNLHTSWQNELPHLFRR